VKVNDSNVIMSHSNVVQCIQ